MIGRTLTSWPRLHVTVDIDWAPDWACRELATFLVDNQMSSTWFVTHPTPLLEELRQHSDLIELGIHPNFLANSSHGTTAAEVLATCMAIVPEATAMRTHALVQSTPILQTVVDTTPIELDLSLYLRGGRDVIAHELPLDHGRHLTRLPYVWEDDLEFFAADPQWDAKHFVESRSQDSGWTVFDVHPIHFVLNSASIGPYQALKARRSDVGASTPSDVADLVNQDRGTADLLRGLAPYVSGRDHGKSLRERVAQPQ